MREILDGNTLTPRFWDKVDELTARITAMLLPLLNLQRQLTVPSEAKQSKLPRTGIFVMYQQLHDIIAMTGYASICMARSPSIFQFEFPEPGQQIDHDQDEVDHKYVFGPSLDRALRADIDAHTATNTSAKGSDPSRTAVPLNRIAKVKIVLWPTIHRYKPHWGTLGSQGKTVIDTRTEPNGATVVVLAKSQSVYYAGKNTDAADIDEGLPTLAAHVRMMRRHRRLAMIKSATYKLAVALLVFAVLIFPMVVEISLRNASEIYERFAARQLMGGCL